jgi:integrase
MAKQGVSTRSESLEYDDFLRLLSCLRADGEYRWELFCFLSYIFALRISDVLNLKWKSLLDREFCVVEEIKTGKTRRIAMDTKTQAKVMELYGLMNNPPEEEYVFFNRITGKVYTSQYINKKLKEFKVRYGLHIKNFSSHTFRKTFGRRIYELHDKSDHSIVLVNRALKHKTIETTIIYLGIKENEVNKLYHQAAI